MGRKTTVKRRQASLVVTAAAAALLFACTDRGTAAPETGILLEVTLADDAASQALDGKIDRLEFWVAYEAPNQPGDYVLIAAQPEPVRDVSGRSLLSDPWKELLVPKQGSGAKIQVLVAAGKADGTLVALGKLKDPDYQEFLAGKIASRKVLLHAQSPDNPPFTVTDTGCVLLSDTAEVLFQSPSDYDCDGYKSKDVGGNDCDDKDPAVHPGAPEDCGNGIDDDCNGKTDMDDNSDADHDGYSKCAGDCDDGDPNINPGAQEECDGKDTNCNGLCDDIDVDGDGWNVCGTWRGPSWDRTVCGTVEEKDKDCADNDLTVHPRAPEVCDGKDNDCNHITDDADADDDGFNDCTNDCDAGDPDVHPGADEICDGKDNDCDGWCDFSTNMVSELPWDRDGDSWTSCGSLISQAPNCSDETDCNEDAHWIHPGAPEICDGYDTDCNPNTQFVSPENQDCFTDNVGHCFKGATSCDDSNPDDPWPCLLQTPGTSDPVPDRICEAYQDCYDQYKDDPASSPAPAACLADRFQWRPPVTCQVTYREDPSEGELCGDPPYDELPRCDTCASCPWTLFVVPGSGWNVYLATLDWDNGGTVSNRGNNFDPCSHTGSPSLYLVADPPGNWGSTSSVHVYLIRETDRQTRPTIIDTTIRMDGPQNMCGPATFSSDGMACDF